jgi:hypothetical protein
LEKEMTNQIENFKISELKNWTKNCLEIIPAENSADQKKETLSFVNVSLGFGPSKPREDFYTKNATDIATEMATLLQKTIDELEKKSKEKLATKPKSEGSGITKIVRFGEKICLLMSSDLRLICNEISELIRYNTMEPGCTPWISESKKEGEEEKGKEGEEKKEKKEKKKKFPSLSLNQKVLK